MPFEIWDSPVFQVYAILFKSTLSWYSLKNIFNEALIIAAFPGLETETLDDLRAPSEFIKSKELENEFCPEVIPLTNFVSPVTVNSFEVPLYKIISSL